MISKKGIDMKALVRLMEEIGVNNYKYTTNRHNVFYIGRRVTVDIPDTTLHGKTHSIRIIATFRNGIKIRRDVFVPWNQVFDLMEHLCENKSDKWDD